jgi:hypothetical protein
MSNGNFSRRRRGGMRFRPSGGLNQNQKPDHSALQARAEATAEPKPDSVFERARHEQEIQRAENLAAGLPPEPQPAPVAEAPEEQQEQGGRGRRGAFRNPHPETPAEVEEEKFEPVPLESPPTGLGGMIKSAANKVMRKVQRMM